MCPVLGSRFVVTEPRRKTGNLKLQFRLRLGVTLIFFWKLQHLYEYINVLSKINDLELSSQ